MIVWRAKGAPGGGPPFGPVSTAAPGAPPPAASTVASGAAAGTAGTGVGTASGTAVRAADLVSEEELRQRPWLKFYPAGARPHLDYPDIPLHRLLEQAATARPQHPAIHFFGRTLTYGRLDELASRFARALDTLGVRPGHRVALMMPNCPQFVIAYYGALKAGAVVVNCNPLYTARELEFQLNDAGAETIVALDLMYRTVREVRDRTPLQRVIVTRINEFMSPLLRALYPLKARREGNWPEIGPSEPVLWLARLLRDSPPDPPAVA
ncbi:MAG TPA: AMP-binding protein, partial [Thermaerobacter sp.]